MRNDINRLEPESSAPVEKMTVRNTAPDCWNISPNGSPLNLARGSASKTYGICASFITLSQFDTHCVAN